MQKGKHFSTSEFSYGQQIEIKACSKAWILKKKEAKKKKRKYLDKVEEK